MYPPTDILALCVCVCVYVCVCVCVCVLQSLYYCCCCCWKYLSVELFATIDYFLTSDLMEIDDGKKYYSETLIRLPNLAISFSNPKLPQPLKSRKELNLPEDNIIYWNCQSLFKYLPQYDYLFPAIASQIKEKCKFIFIKFPLSDFVNQQFTKRLKKAFNQYGLNSEEYCIFLNGLSEAHFLNVTFLADVGLDTIGWSGGKTALEAVSCDLPVVTYPQQLMRSRHSYGILKMIEVEDTIAQSEQEYIDIAVKLGNNPEYRQQIKQKINNNKYKLFEDTECIKGLEEFLISLHQ